MPSARTRIQSAASSRAASMPSSRPAWRATCEWRPGQYTLLCALFVCWHARCLFTFIEQDGARLCGRTGVRTTERKPRVLFWERERARRKSTVYTQRTKRFSSRLLARATRKRCAAVCVQQVHIVHICTIMERFSLHGTIEYLYEVRVHST